MEVIVNPRNSDVGKISDDEILKYLLQYILECQSICHEYYLVAYLMKLDANEKNQDIAYYLDKVGLYVDEINLKLSSLDYKIVKVNHDLGKNAITKTILNILNDTVFGSTDRPPASSKFYIYTNTLSSNDTKLATPFLVKELDFIKWCIEQFVNSFHIIANEVTDTSSLVVKEISTFLLKNDLKYSADEHFWDRSTSFALGSNKLNEYQDFNALEIESILHTLCERKWFYQTHQGLFSLDIKGVAELQEYLKTTYDMKCCSVCEQLVFRGVLCDKGGSQDICSVWHIDCYKHHVLHIDKKCNECNNDIINNSIYIL